MALSGLLILGKLSAEAYGRMIKGEPGVNAGLVCICYIFHVFQGEYYDDFAYTLAL